MSYRIDYTYHRKYRNRRQNHLWLKVISTVIIIALGIYSLQYIPWKSLLPGDPKVTGDALDRLVSSIGNGETIAEAFSTFCQDIVAHANLPQ